MPLPPLSNQLQRARQILEALQQGIDPIAHCELPSGSIVNNIEVNRAIGLGGMALDQMNTRMQRRAHLPSNVGRPWVTEEENFLVEAFKGGESVKGIAARHGRTVRAVESRLQMLGLLKATERTTFNSLNATTKGRGDNE